MVVRREAVRLELIDEFTTRAARIAASADALAASIDGTADATRRSSRANTTATRSSERYATQTDRLRQSLDGLPRGFDNSARGMDGFSRRARQTERQLDSVTGRINLLAEGLITLGPGLIPIGALAVPAITGLANQLGVAVLAAGTAAIAFHGVGDALTAVNNASIEPSAENLEKVRQAMEAIGPEGADLVNTIHGLGDEWDRLQRDAQSQLFPGLSDAIGSLRTLTPDLAGILREVGGALGDIAAEGAASLAGPRWEGFFTFLEQNARPTLTGLANAGGNLAHALAEIWQATTPLNNGFTNWLVDATGDLDRFASGLSETQGFQDFVAYIRAEGPQVGETLGAIANAALQIVQAAAPIGGPVLAALEALADVVSTIADSDIGTPLFAGTAAVLALNRALTITRSLAARGTGALTAFNAPIVAMRGAVTSASGSIRTFNSDIRTLSSSQALFNRSARQSYSSLAGSIRSGFVGPMTEAEDRARRTAAAGERLRNSFKTIGKGAAIAGGLALVTSDVDDKMGLANTATLALAGSMAGPWGAAVGAGVGLMMDLSKYTTQAEQAQENFNATLRSGDIASINAELQKNIALQKNYDEAPTQRVTGGRGASAPAPKGENPYDDLVEGGNEYLGIAGKITTALGGNANSIADVTAKTNEAAPAMAHFGYTIESLSKMSPAQFAQASRNIAEYTTQAKLGDAASSQFGQSVRGMALEAIAAAQSTNSLTTAVSAFISPALTAEAASDSLLTKFKAFKDLDVKAGFSGTTEAALANRDATRQAAVGITELLEAKAKNGASEKQLANTLARERKAFIDSGVAAGFSRKEMRKRADEIGLTPRLVKTVFETAGVDETDRKVSNFKGLLKALPKRVLTDIAANGVPKSKADVEALQKKYDLTPEQVKTLMKLDGVSQAIGDAGRVQSAINQVTGKTVTITTIMRTVSQNAASNSGNAPQNRAGGGRMVGPGTATSDSIPALLSNGEWVIRAAAVAKYGDRLLSDINSMRFATGGPVRLARGGKPNPIRRADKQFNLTPTLDVQGVQSELNEFEKAMKHAHIRLGKRFDALSTSALNTAKALTAEREKRQKLIDKIGEVRSSAAGSFDNDIFSKDLSALRLQLAADTNDSRSMAAAIKKAGGKGLSGGLEQGLAASGNIALAQQIAGLSASQIAQLERQYGGRTTAQNALGDMAVAMSGLPQALTGTNREIAAMAKKIEGLETKIENGVRRGARQGLNDHEKGRDRKGSARVATGRR